MHSLLEGTGKTTTMVEAILQIYQSQPNTNILVASATNSACDTITSYLLKYKEIIENDILRLYGEMVLRDHEQLDPGILAISNIQNGEHRFPSLNYLCNFRIIIATMTSCGRLLQGGMPKDFFTHVFIDECGSVRETTALIPMCEYLKSLKLNFQLTVCFYRYFNVPQFGQCKHYFSW
jgi:helicase MOV-10